MVFILLVAVLGELIIFAITAPLYGFQTGFIAGTIAGACSGALAAVVVSRKKAVGARNEYSMPQDGLKAPTPFAARFDAPTSLRSSTALDDADPPSSRDRHG